MSDDVWPGMPRPAHRHLTRYIAARQHDLRLDHWVIVLEDEPCEVSSNAKTWIASWQHRARIMLSPDFHGFTREQKRTTLIHELLHLPLHGTLLVLDSETEARKIIGSNLADVLQDQTLMALEHGIDDIAEAIAPRFPLP